MLSDICPKALEVASKNASELGLEVEIRQGDLLAPFEGEKVDVLIANPPYIAKKDYDFLESEVKEYEPSLALIGGDDGYLYYERFKTEMVSHLAPGAKIYFEIGTGMGQKILSMFDEPHWKSKRCEKDWSGQERFFYLEFEPILH